MTTRFCSFSRSLPNSVFIQTGIHSLVEIAGRQTRRKQGIPSHQKIPSTLNREENTRDILSGTQREERGNIDCKT